MKIKLLIALNIFSWITAYLIWFLKIKKKDIFIQIFKNNSQPSLIIDNRTKNIKWFNESFKVHFPNINKNDSIENLNPIFLMKHIQVTSKKNEWIANNSNLDSETGIVLSLINKCEFKWWKDLPFPIATINSNYEIQDENDTFKELIDKSQYKNNINEIRNLMKIAKYNKNHEIILYSSEGVYPCKIWITPYKNKHIVFIENRIEYVKLKNKAQECQHLQILGQLTSSIIHDFNNLLTCIYGFTEMLDDKLPYDKNISEIKNNLEKAKELSEELLNFIKEKPIENKQIEPKKHILKMKNMLQKLLGEKIKLEINANTNGFIKLSETQLERIILNMVINSKDAMVNGGTFKINTSEQYIQTYTKTEDGKILQPGSYYIIDVVDNGPGISPEQVKKVFIPFFTTKLKGTGLGLSSCLKIIEHIGGTIKLSTSPKHTTFSIVVPLIKNEKKMNKNDEKNIKNDTKNSQNDNKYTIILVEDEEPILNLVKKSLESQYTVYAFNNGQEALEAIKTIQFDCLISDVVLPEIGGIEIAKQARKINENVKICIVSGYDLQSVSNELPDNTTYIKKPFTLNKLKEAVNNLFE